MLDVFSHEKGLSSRELTGLWFWILRVIKGKTSLFQIGQTGYRGSGGSCLVVLLAPEFKHSCLNYAEVCWHFVDRDHLTVLPFNPLPGICLGQYRKLETQFDSDCLGHRPITVEVVSSSKKNTHWLSLQGNHLCPLAGLRQLHLQHLISPAGEALKWHYLDY